MENPLHSYYAETGDIPTPPATPFTVTVDTEAVDGSEHSDSGLRFFASLLAITAVLLMGLFFIVILMPHLTPTAKIFLGGIIGIGLAFIVKTMDRLRSFAENANL